MITQELQHSDYRIRKLIGVLGIFLPVILPLAKLEFLASISHYYYATLSSLLFIIILSAFALFLISYKGYKIDTTTEMVSDDLLTNIGGLAALVVVFIPTKCHDSASEAIDVLCASGDLPLFGHNNPTLSTIHLVCAGIFILCMGWMARYKFTRGTNDGYNKIYKLCGNLVFSAVGLLIVFLILDLTQVNFPLRDYYVYIFETLAIVPFGIAWLIKGETIEGIKAMGKRLFG